MKNPPHGHSTTDDSNDFKKPNRSLVSIFGSAGPQPGTPRYDEALELGRGIADLGIDVLTGGYGGTMEAASRGANEAGGVVVGATCDAIESFRPGTLPNQWVTLELRTETLIKRLVLVTSSCHAAVILPGGVGTLLEFALLWNSTMIEELEPVPILVVGDVWKDLLALMDNPQFVAPAHMAMVEYCPDIPTVITRLGELLPHEPGLES